MAHAQARTSPGHDVGGQAHVLHAAGDDDFGVAAANRLGSQVQRLEPGAADLVEGHCRHGVWQAGIDRGLAGGVLPGAGSQHLAKNHLIDLGRVEPGLLQQAADDGRASSTAGTVASAPWKLPMAVRVAATMTTSCMWGSRFFRWSPRQPCGLGGG